MPHTGRFDGMYYSVGYAGHGLALGTYLGTKTAGLICGDPQRHPIRWHSVPQCAAGLAKRAHLGASPRWSVLQMS